MSRIAPVDPATATGAAAELLDTVKSKFGGHPNILATMANAPAVLQSYLQVSGAMGEASIGAPLRERIALAVSEDNACDYCLAAHSAIGKSVGLGEAELLESRRGSVTDPKIQAALDLAREIAREKGRVSDATLASTRDAGWNDQEILEIFGATIHIVFTNWFNHLADTDVDFPPAAPLAQTATA